MEQANQHGSNKAHENGSTVEKSPSRQRRSITALTLDLSNTIFSSSRGIPATPATPLPKSPKTLSKGAFSDDPVIDNLLDREERAVAALLTRFKALVTLAAEPTPDGATKEASAAHGLQMEVESSALVRATEDLLQLTRELKELWLFGPLRNIKEGEGEGQMDEDSQRVGELLEAVLKRATDRPSPS